MELSKFEKDMAIIQALDDEPNDVGGLSSSELKAKFDEGGEALKKYLNETLVPGINNNFATKEEVNDIALGEIPDGSVTPEKLDRSYIGATIIVSYNKGGES